MSALLLSWALLGAGGAAAQGGVPLDAAQPQARAITEAGRDVLGADWDDGPALREDLPNFHEVEPGFYRLAQPTAEGVRRLRRQYGVNTLLTLRLSVDAAEQRAAGALGMTVRNVKMNGLLLPRFSEVDAALRALREPAYRPIAVHCRRGRDRTGVVVAAYEVVVRGRGAREAADEAHGIGCCPPTFVVPLERYLELYKRHAEGDRTAMEPDESSATARRSAAP